MRNPDEIITDAKQRMEELKNDDEVIKKALKLIDYVSGRNFKDFTGDELTRIAGELAILKVNLGRVVSDKMLEAKATYTYRKWKYSKEYQAQKKQWGSKMTVGEAEAVAEDGIENEREAELLSEHQADTLQTLYEDMGEIIRVIQTRIGYLKSERIESGEYN